MKNKTHPTLKVLELLGSGFLLALEKNKKRRRGLHNECDKIWYEIDRKQLYQILSRLKLRGLVKMIQTSNEKEHVALTQKGKTEFLKKEFKNLKLSPPKRWDKKWRLVLFDIPESKRTIRDALRKKLKNLGFIELQKSVFIYPYPCDVEVNFIINILNISQYVYYVESSIVADGFFRKSFNL